MLELQAHPSVKKEYKRGQNKALQVKSYLSEQNCVFLKDDVILSNSLRFFLPTEGFSMVFFFRVPCERNLFWGPYLFTVSILYLLFLLTECCVGWFGSQFSSWPVKWPFTAFWHSFLQPGCCFLWLPLASVSPDHVSSTGSIQSVV